MEMVKELIERNRLVAEMLLKENKRAYIKDYDGNIYFCEILLVGETSLRITCFDPVQRRGQKFTLYFPLIEKIREYKTKEVPNEELSF